VPLAFPHTWLAIVVWFLAIPLQLLWSRYRPPATERYLP
jgi:hypothetical protein